MSQGPAASTSPGRAEPTAVRSGILVVDKPGGWTSHQVVGRVRRLAGTRKVGHAGTLDPMATGVLVVGIERATRLLGHLALHDKAYLATIRLGQETVTDDAEGEVTTARGAAGVELADVADLLPRFRGEIEQVPSSVSAIKVQGKRAYARVRSGEEVTLAARRVTVSSYEILASERLQVDGIEVLDLQVSVDCSSGTYIRALARDLGRLLGVGGHLTALRRTRVGPFQLSDVGLSAEGVTSAEVAGFEPLSMAEAARRCFPVREVSAPAATDILYGRPLELDLDALTALISPAGDLLALYRPQDGRAVAEAVLA